MGGPIDPIFAGMPAPGVAGRPGGAGAVADDAVPPERHAGGNGLAVSEARLPTASRPVTVRSRRARVARGAPTGTDGASGYGEALPAAGAAGAERRPPTRPRPTTLGRASGMTCRRPGAGARTAAPTRTSPSARTGPARRPGPGHDPRRPARRRRHRATTRARRSTSASSCAWHRPSRRPCSRRSAKHPTPGSRWCAATPIACWVASSMPGARTSSRCQVREPRRRRPAWTRPRRRACRAARHGRFASIWPVGPPGRRPRPSPPKTPSRRRS